MRIREENMYKSARNPDNPNPDQVAMQKDIDEARKE
jgi:hypothetical protein